MAAIRHCEMEFWDLLLIEIHFPWGKLFICKSRLILFLVTEVLSFVCLSLLLGTGELPVYKQNFTGKSPTSCVAVDVWFKSLLLSFETGSLYGPGCPRTYCIDQSDLQLTELHQPVPPECQGHRPVPPRSACDLIFMVSVYSVIKCWGWCIFCRLLRIRKNHI